MNRGLETLTHAAPGVTPLLLLQTLGWVKRFPSSAYAAPGWMSVVAESVTTRKGTHWLFRSRGPGHYPHLREVGHLRAPILKGWCLTQRSSHARVPCPVQCFLDV